VGCVKQPFRFSQAKPKQPIIIRATEIALNRLKMSWKGHKYRKAITFVVFLDSRNCGGEDVSRFRFKP
jgi:hypothetical protein